METKTPNPRHRNRMFALVFAGLLALVNPITLMLLTRLVLSFVFKSSGATAEDTLPLSQEMVGLFSFKIFLLDLALIALIFYAFVAKSDIRSKNGFRAVLMGGLGISFLLFYLGCNHFFAGRLIPVRLIQLALTGWCWTRAFYWGVVKNTGSRKWFQHMFTGIIGVLILLLLTETVFLFVGRSHQNNQTLASRNWFARNWTLNDRGYRDATMEEKIASSEKKILLLGDSFTTGHGIKKTEDRFGDLLDTQLEGWQVLNLGMNGSDSENELERLQEWEETGEVLVLVWFINDIHEAAAYSWKSWETYSEATLSPPRQNLSLMLDSYLFNYLYWLRPPSPKKSYRAFLEDAYQRETVINRHLKTIEEITTLSESRNMKTAVMLFPFMEDVAGSEFALGPIRKRLQEQEIPVLDLRPILMEQGPDIGWVHPADPHPNKEVHQLVAISLEEFLLKNGLLDE